MALHGDGVRHGVCCLSRRGAALYEVDGVNGTEARTYPLLTE